jgi:hypothetical protein
LKLLSLFLFIFSLNAQADAISSDSLQISIAPRAQFESELPRRVPRVFVREAHLKAGLWSPKSARLEAMIPDAPVFAAPGALSSFALQLQEPLWETQKALGVGVIFGAQVRLLERTARGQSQALQLWSAPIGIETSYLPLARGPRVHLRAQALPSLGLLERSPMSDRASLRAVGALLTFGLSQSLGGGQSLMLGYELQSLSMGGADFSGDGLTLGWVARID